MLDLKVTHPNYCATIVTINNMVTLNGLDNLVGVPIFGFNALVSKNYGTGDAHKYILFTAETQLSEQYCFKNNLYDRPELNEDPFKKGYINSKRRVRALKLKGHNSSALLMKVDSLDCLGIDSSLLNVGDSFNSINGIDICTKYIIRHQRSQSNKVGKARPRKFKNRSLLDSRLIPEHIDTTHWARNKHKISDDAQIIVTQKIHGCVYKDTLVKTLEYGEKRIQDIVDSKLKCKILARDISNNSDIYVDIDDYYYKKNDGEWFEIELENGAIIKITGDNPVYLPKFNCYRMVKDLVENDEVQLCE